MSYLCFDPFHRKDSGVGVAAVMASGDNKRIEIRKLIDFEPSELSRVASDLYGLEMPAKTAKDRKALFELVTGGWLWPLPAEPPEGALGDLTGELVRVLYEYVDLPDPSYYHAFACRVVGSYVEELLPRHPLFWASAPTRSGKTRLCEVHAALSYRGTLFKSPTAAALYRQVDRYRTSVAIDEFQALGEDTQRDVLSILRSAFDGPGLFVRAKERSRENEYYRVAASYVVASKTGPPEDVANRGYHIVMRESSRTDLQRRVDADAFARLRGRLLRFRLETLADKRQLLQERADELTLRPVSVSSKPGLLPVQLDYRAADVAAMLLAVGLQFDPECREVLQATASAQAWAIQELLDTPEAKVAFALQGCVNDELAKSKMIDDFQPRTVENLGEKKITVGDVCTQLRRDEDLDQRDQTWTPKRVGQFLRGVFGIATERGAGGAYRISDPRFPEKYAAIVRKYGPRPASSTPDKKVN